MFLQLCYIILILLFQPILNASETRLQDSTDTLKHISIVPGYFFVLGWLRVLLVKSNQTLSKSIKSINRCSFNPEGSPPAMPLGPSLINSFAARWKLKVNDSTRAPPGSSRLGNPREQIGKIKRMHGRFWEHHGKNIGTIYIYIYIYIYTYIYIHIYI